MLQDKLHDFCCPFFRTFSPLSLYESYCKCLNFAGLRTLPIQSMCVLLWFSVGGGYVCSPYVGVAHSWTRHCLSYFWNKPVWIFIFLFSRNNEHHIWARSPSRGVYLVPVGSSGHGQVTEEQTWGGWVPLLVGYWSDGWRRLYVRGDWCWNQSFKGRESPSEEVHWGGKLSLLPVFKLLIAGVHSSIYYFSPIKCWIFRTGLKVICYKVVWNIFRN